jgi:hypothetical protein
VEIREPVAGQAGQLVALFASVLPDSPTAQLNRRDEAEAFLRDASSFAFDAYVNEIPVGLAWGLQTTQDGTCDFPATPRDRLAISWQLAIATCGQNLSPSNPYPTATQAGSAAAREAKPSHDTAPQPTSRRRAPTPHHDPSG